MACVFVVDIEVGDFGIWRTWGAAVLGPTWREKNGPLRKAGPTGVPVAQRDLCP
jgi:hypothetical protein